jgi:hypothetical protein
LIAAWGPVGQNRMGLDDRIFSEYRREKCRQAGIAASGS